MKKLHHRILIDPSEFFMEQIYIYIYIYIISVHLSASLTLVFTRDPIFILISPIFHHNVKLVNGVVVQNSTITPLIYSFVTMDWV